MAKGRVVFPYSNTNRVGVSDVATFDSPDLNLGHLLRDIDDGKVQLPDFQREWKWDDDRIRSLIASIARGHPVGVLMLLEVGGDGTRFAPKPIAGVSLASTIEPDQLILDGQQRLTSLYQSLMSTQPVGTTDSRGKKLERWYYIDINQGLDPQVDMEDAVLAIPPDKVVRDDFGRNIVADYSTLDGECQAEVFPLSRVFNPAAIFEWHGHYVTTGADAVARVERWNRFYQGVLQNLVGYTIPAIVLKKDTPKEAVCTVFEKVNTGGVPLDVFELLTATYAADNFRLKDDWRERKARLDVHPVLRGVQSTEFLQAIALLATRAKRLVWQPISGSPQQAPGIGCRRRDILALTLAEYERWAPEVLNAYEWCAPFLAQEFIFIAPDVPYRTQLVPLAAIKTVLGKQAESHGAGTSLRRWFWSGILGELYGGTTETRFSRDVEQVPPWITESAQPPATITDAVFREQRLYSLRTRNSAAYKGIYALLMRNGSRDWLKTQAMNMASFFNYQVDIHHVFPKSWCEKNGVDDQHRESVVNKTAISRETNQIIGGKSPRIYVPALEKRGGTTSSELDEILRSHEIDPTALRNAAFAAFFDDRKERLLHLVSEAMGKEAIRDATTASPPDEFEQQEDEPDEPSPEELASLKGEGSDHPPATSPEARVGRPSRANAEEGAQP